MSLSPGTHVGSYRVVGPLGKGGMGEVYRALDTRLGRDVAIKILPAVFTTDADRTARFDREARVLAALNHPGIAAIYGIEDFGDQPTVIARQVAWSPDGAYVFAAVSKNIGDIVMFDSLV